MDDGSEFKEVETDRGLKALRFTLTALDSPSIALF